MRMVFQNQNMPVDKYQAIRNAILVEAERRDREGIPFSPSEKFTLTNSLLFWGHYGVTPGQLAAGYSKDGEGKAHALKNVRMPLKNSVQDNPEIEYDIANEVLTSTDPAGGDILVDNPMSTPTFGGASGIVPMVWIPRMMRDMSRYTMAKNFAMQFPAPGPGFKMPVKKTTAEDVIGSVSPVAEGRAGAEVSNAYGLDQWDAYKYKFHTGFSLEVVEATRGYIDVYGDMGADMVEGAALLTDTDYFESQYEAINKGYMRRWNGSAWAYTQAIPRGAAYVLTTNVVKHVLFYNIKSGVKKVYSPAVTTGDENKFGSATELSGLAINNNLELWDVFPILAQLLSDKASKMEYVALDPRLVVRLVQDSRFQNSQYKTGNVVMQSENGFLGTFFLGGSQSKTDVWALPPRVLNSKVTDDASPLAIYPVIAGSYGKSGVIAPWLPPGLTSDKGYEVKTVDGVSVLRPNDTDVLTMTQRQVVEPYDMRHLAILKVVQTT